MNTFVSFIVVLGLLIFVHELGHFLFAKLFKVRVLKFSLGFGPKLVSKTFGETEYLISAFPLGGYVKMFGENPDEQQVDAGEQTVSFAHKPVWQRFLIVLAGPVFNLIFPVLLFFAIFLIVGVPESVDTTRIGMVNDDSPAKEAGLRVGDTIVEINSQPTLKWVDVLNNVKASNGEEIDVVISRDGERITTRVKPMVSDVKNIFKEVVDQRYMIGIVKDEKLVHKAVGPVDACVFAFRQTGTLMYLTGLGFVKIIQRVIPASELGGPILIAQMAGEQLKAGWVNLFYFMGLLSVNLGILNLLPVPVLDGGHLAFLTVESLRRKPLTEKAQIVAQQVGIALLGTLMIFVFYNDIARLLK